MHPARKWVDYFLMAVSRKTLASWYLQTAQHLEAGLPLAQAMASAVGPPEGDIRRMVDSIESGRSFDDVLRHAPRWLPRADRVFLSAALQTGRLPQTLQTLADHHRTVGANRMKAVLGMIYPLGMLHLGAVILPLTGMIDFEQGFQWSTSAYLQQVLMVLLPIWTLIGLIVFLASTDNPLLPGLMRAIPLLRGYSRTQALADFSHALGTFLEVGLPVKRSWQGAAALSRDPRIRRAVASLEPILDRQEDPAPHLKRQACFPPEFLALYQAGAKTGQLDKNLLTLGKRFQETANARMTLAAIVYPSLLFIAVAAWIVLAIFRIYGGYLEHLGNFFN